MFYFKDSWMALGLPADEDDERSGSISKKSQGSKKKRHSPFMAFSQWVPFPVGIMDRDRAGACCCTVNKIGHEMG